MGKLIYSMMVSLDGYIETVDHSLDWVIPDEELHSFINDQVRDQGGILYGRRLYQLMADFWPTADADPSAPPYIADYSRIWKATPKVVFSTTLESVDWNSRLVKEDAAGEIARLKAESEKDWEIGGPNLAATAIRHGLVDEIHQFVHPVVLGKGTPFLPSLEDRINLRLLETRSFNSGVVYLRYGARE
jgi:dihydrofolate reductase